MDVKVEKAVFVGIITDKDDESKVMEYLDELEFLAETAGATGDKKFVQRLERPDNATYIRSGKLQEIAEYCEENEINYVIFDDELSGTQQRNIEKIIKTASVIGKGLIENGFPEENALFFKNLSDAERFFPDLFSPNDAVLFLNDLPDELKSLTR